MRGRQFQLLRLRSARTRFPGWRRKRSQAPLRLRNQRLHSQNFVPPWRIRSLRKYREANWASYTQRDDYWSQRDGNTRRNNGNCDLKAKYENSTLLVRLLAIRLIDLWIYRRVLAPNGIDVKAGVLVDPVLVHIP
jgi:hypothetical protein